mgnify:CR=1 FL=1
MIIVIALLLIVFYDFWLSAPAFWPAAVMRAVVTPLDVFLLKRHHVGAVLVLLGALSNATVMLVNGGGMPVLGLQIVHDRWKPLDHTTTLPELADVLWMGFSIGDCYILAGLLAVVINWAAEFAGRDYR